MSNFWSTSDGSNAQQNEGTFEMGGGDIPPIPTGTNVLAIAEEANNASYESDEYINVKWRISKPAEYANRVIFQKIRAYDDDAAKSDKAKRMLSAIATNSGGGLFTAMQQRNETKPSDQSLSQLCNRPMVLKLDVWEIDKDRNGNPLPAAEVKRGNWVQAVAPVKGGQQQAAPVQQPATQPAAAFDGLDDSDIPF